MIEKLTIQSNKCLHHLEVFEEDVLTRKNEKEPTNSSRVSLVSINTTSSTTSSARSTRDSILELYERDSYYQQILAPRESSFQEAPEFQRRSAGVASFAANLEQLLSHEIGKSGDPSELSTTDTTMAPVDLSYYVQPNCRMDESVQKVQRLLQTDLDPSNERFHLQFLLRSLGDGDLADLVYADKDFVTSSQLLRYTLGVPDSQMFLSTELRRSSGVQLLSQTTKRLTVMRAEDYEFWEDILDEHNTDHASHLVVVHGSVKFAAICLRKSPAFSTTMKPPNQYDFSSCEEGQV